MRKAWIWIVIIVIIVLAGFWWWSTQLAPQSPLSDDGTPAAVDAQDDANASGTPPTASSSDVGTGAVMQATVTYDGTKFSPDPVVIKQGGTVTWINKSGHDMWVASNPHPIHTAYSGTTRTQHCPDTAGAGFDECQGSTGNYTFTFQKPGTWGYHDHLNASSGGTVIVQ